MKGSNQTQKEKQQREDVLNAEHKRVDHQRNLFTFLPVVPTVEALKQAMLQRAYNLMWDGLCEQADAIMEFLPSRDVSAMLDCWEIDIIEGREKSKWYHNA